MDDIQKALNNYIKNDVQKKHGNGAHPIREEVYGFKAGYKAAEDKLKCCGNCKMFTGSRCYVEASRKHGYVQGTSGEGICDKWEARK